MKLTLVPALIAGATLGSRRWGPQVGGWLNALPLVAGPVLLFLALEHGAAFAARAAEATLLGLVAVAAFALAYAWMALRFQWWAAVMAGWAAFGAVTVAIQPLGWRPAVAFAAAILALIAAYRLLPATVGVRRASAPPIWDLPARMAAAAALVLTVTGLADLVGPRWSGALTPFPVATAILVSFAHAQGGVDAAITFLAGFLPAMCTFALFAFVLALAFEPLGTFGAIAVALPTQLAAHGVLLTSTLVRLRTTRAVQVTTDFKA